MTEQQDLQNNTRIGWDSYTKNQLFETAKIAGIVAIVSIVNVIIGAIGYFYKPKSATQLVEKEGFNDSTLQFVGSTTALSVVFSLIINGLLFYLLYRFSTLAKKAIITDNPGQLGQGLTSLSTYFKVVGILILAVIGLLFVAMLFMSLGAATK